MVKGVSRFQRKMKAIPDSVREEVTRTIEGAANDLVADMRTLNPLPNEIEINWTWGDAPKGAVTLGRVGRNRYDKIAATIYARGDTFAAHWFEFGTAPRFQATTGRATGRIEESPFFFPAYRGNRRRLRARITRAVARGFRKVK